MSHVAILGAGPIGASLAHRLAGRGQVGSVTLIDAADRVAAGKALDIFQAAPIQGTVTRTGSAADPLAAIGASVVVVADEVDAGEWEGERGLAMLSRLASAGCDAPLVFAGSRQTWLMEQVYREAGLPASRLIGSAPAGVVSALQAWTALELDLARADVAVIGRPPAFVVAWSAATSAGALVTDRIPAHRLRTLAAAVERCWPPGPLLTASATAPIVEALVGGSRRLHPALTIVDGDLGVRGRAVLLPLQLDSRGVRSYVVPSLSPQERTELLNSVAAR